MADAANTVSLLNNYLMPSTPVKREELLKGRTKELQHVLQSLDAAGRNVFILGDRGVGKSSLAQTAAYRKQSSDQEPALLSCDPQSTFFSLSRDIAKSLIRRGPLEQSRTKKYGAAATLSPFTAQVAREIQEGIVPVPTSVNEAIALIRFGGDCHSRVPVVVLDEFDRLTPGEDRSLFGDLIKQLGDQEIQVKFLFCGVGQSLEDLLAGHESSYRYLAGVRLERLGLQALIDITRQAANATGIRIKEDYVIRAARISDGFPHYTHLISWSLFSILLRETPPRRTVLSRDYADAIEQSTLDVEPRLRQMYQRAAEKYSSDEYQHILWALASHPDLRRPSKEIYKDYQRIATACEVEALDRTRFNSRINALKASRHGSVLKGSRTGWYEFAEPMLRGYCRLRAEAKGLDLGLDYNV
jgi:hypothetical protein